MPTLIGDDQLNDHIIGSDGDDTISGLGGNDLLEGNAGNDTILGGAGDDILTGGSGLDILTGGFGVDRFTDTAAGLNGDRITDFLPGDRIQITNLTALNANIGVSGSTITYNGGAVTVDNLGPGRLIVRDIQGGGVEIRLQPIAENDFNGDGRSDLLLRHANGTMTDWLGQSNGSFVSNQAVASYGLSTAWHVEGTGDFNGDGLSDLLLRHDSGAVTNWLGQANGSFFSNHAVANYSLPTGWHIAGTGDFNGDSREDVLLRHDNGTVTDWLGQANGSFVSNHTIANYSLPAGWGVAGTGDFNGDGLEDVLLRHTSGTITEWLGQANGGFFSNHAISTYDLDPIWDVAGIGDFNGDGRDDVLLMHSNGSVTNWLGQANGSFFSNHAAASYALPSGWGVETVGDFNGDSRDDVLLRHTNGTITNWLGQSNGDFFSNHAIANYPIDTAWSVLPAF